jgi:phage terminase large subunit-like protein
LFTTSKERWFLESIANRLDPADVEFVENSLAPISFPLISQWAENNFIDPVTSRLVRLEQHQKRILNRIFERIFALEVTTVVWSEIKKSGKTTTAGIAGCYWAENVEAPNEIISVANDQEQATGRIYGAMKPTLRRLGWYVPEVKPEMRNARSDSVVKAIGTNYAGEAGGNYGLTLWSELWCYSSESRRRLWAEMTQVPTRKYSCRWVETYAGYLGESDLLWELYQLIFKDGDEDQPRGEREFEDLPVWYLPEYKTIAYWSHEPRMPWQTPEFMEQQRHTPGMRPNEYSRLWQNKWVEQIDQFIPIESWDACYDPELISLQHDDERQIVIGCDGSTKRDLTAMVVATYDPALAEPSILYWKVWRPQENEAGNKIIDLEETLKAEIIELLDEWGLSIVKIVWDPYQLHSIMTDLQKKYDKHGTRKLFEEFPQTNKRIQSDMAFFDYIASKKLRHSELPGNDSSDLRHHVQNTVARSTERGFRIDKEATAKKIDLAVAASMACFAASTSVRPKRKFLRV